MQVFGGGWGQTDVVAMNFVPAISNYRFSSLTHKLKIKVWCIRSFFETNLCNLSMILNDIIITICSADRISPS